MLGGGRGIVSPAVLLCGWKGARPVFISLAHSYHTQDEIRTAGLDYSLSLSLIFIWLWATVLTYTPLACFHGMLRIVCNLSDNV